MPDDDKRILPMDEQAEFVTSFVDESKQARKAFEEIWDEVEMNFLVQPLHEFFSPTRYPLDPNLRTTPTAKSPLSAGQAILKDSETHQSIMTIVSKLVLSVMGEPGFIRAKKVGGEDLFKAKVAGELIEHAMRKEGHFWTMIEWVLAGSIYGTGVVEAFWDFQEGPREFPNVSFDPETGEEKRGSEILIAPIYDDVRYRCLDIRKFYPDPSETMMSRMLGAAKMFRITKDEALRRAESGLYDEEAVRRAIEARGSDENFENDEDQATRSLARSRRRRTPGSRKSSGLSISVRCRSRPKTAYRTALSRSLVERLSGVSRGPAASRSST